MKKFTTLLLALLLVLPAMAVTMTGGEVLYLTPNSNWKQSNARFAVYFFGNNGNTWASMTKVEGETDLYQVTVPSGSWNNLIFCRMNPSASANNWNNKWNQTSDLTYDGTNNHYTVKSGTWDSGGGTWSVYTPPVAGEPVLELTITPESVYVNEEVTMEARVTENEPADYTISIQVSDAESVVANGSDNLTWTPTVAGEYTVIAICMVGNEEKARATQGLTVNKHGIYLRGEMNGWASSDDYFMSMAADGTYSWTGTMTNGEFKIDRYGDWSESYGGAGSISQAGTYNLTNNGANMKWTGGTCEMTITVAADFKTMTIVTDGSTDPVEPADPILYIVGTMNGWGHNTLMTWDAESETFSWTGDLEANAEFLFTPADNWNNKYGYASEEAITFGTYALKAEGANIKWGGGASNVTITVNKDCNSMSIVKNSVYYEENILCETNYFLYPNEDWKKDGAWFAAYFQNKNTGAYTWVKGEMLATNYVLFYLSQYNVPENAAAPARAKAEDMPVYTHVTFHRMSASATEMVAINSWNEAGPLTYDGEVYKITGWNHSGEWVNFDDIQTAIKDVEVANGITYAYGVISAEGAIEVYNMSGAVVARGNDNIDLRGLNGGIYIVRCGDNVRKVVR